MIALRIQTSRPEELTGIRQWLKQQENHVVAGSRPGVPQLHTDGCLLLAYRNKAPVQTLTGAVGLDLMRMRVCLLAARQSATQEALLEAVERLAVSFGMPTISLHSDPHGGRGIALPGAWRPTGKPGVWQRTLSRRQTALGRRVREMHAILGIPANYGCSHRLRLQPEPAELASIGLDVFGREQFMLPKAAEALRKMLAEAKDSGLEIQPVSAFRSVDYQQQLLQNKLAKGQRMTDILRVSAAPGYSEHHSGRAVDLTSPGFKPLEEEFADSPAHAWLNRHAGKFGFHLSYPRGNRHGVAYEPWHWYWFGQ